MSLRLPLWWWNLRLRSKALLIVIVPALTIAVPAVYALVLNDSQNDLRAAARHNRELQDEVATLGDRARDDSLDTLADLLGTGPPVVDDGGLADGYDTVLADLADRVPTRAAAPLAAWDDANRALLDVIDAAPTDDPAASTSERAASAAAISLAADEAATAEANVIAALHQESGVLRDEIDDRNRQIVVSLVVGIVAGLITGTVALMLFARSIVKRIDVVYAAAERVLDGGAIGDVETPADDELGRLAAHLALAAEMLIAVNEESARSRDVAVAATTAKDDFLSRMSHELRTPLTAILGFGQLMQLEDELRPDDRDAVDQIVKAGRHLLELINDLLDISRIATGHLSLSLEDVPLDATVGAVIDLLRPQAAEQGVAVRSTVRDGMSVVADHQRLRQVLINLVSNAVKYNVTDGWVHIGAVERDGVVRLEVEDSGRGISTEHRQLLFQPFERLDAPSTIQGTGVGLALSKSLVEAMGGQIGVESLAGAGSTFWVELARGADEPPLEASGEPAVPESTAPAGTDHTVLYVEDNLANVRVLERLMRGRAERLEVAMQGGIAIDLARQLRPALVLLDLHLPDRNGAEVLAALKADPATSSIPVAVLSADATDGGRRRLLDLGAAAYLTKPIDLTLLTELLDDVAGAARRR